MQPVQFDHVEDSRLRFVFSNTALTFGLTADATFGEVALMLDNLSSNQRYGDPVAIDVTFGVAPRREFGTPHAATMRRRTADHLEDAASGAEAGQ